MSYYFGKTIKTSFNKAVAKVTDELTKESFGIRTEIGVRKTSKKKLNVDFK